MVTYSLNQCVSVPSLLFPELTRAVGHNFTLLQGIFQSKIISATLGTYINSIMPLRLNIKTDRPVGALVMAIQSVCLFLIFFFVVAT
jgi:hypothetical protein